MGEIITSTAQVKGLLMSLKPVIRMTEERLNKYIESWFMTGNTVSAKKQRQSPKRIKKMKRC